MNRLRRDFLIFHRDNQEVYSRLVEFCEALWDRGWRHYGMHTVLHALRYRFDLETGGEEVTLDGGEVRRVKLNNNHSAYYARLVAYKVPKFRTFFEYRRVHGEDQGRPVLFSDNPKHPDIYMDGTLVSPQMELLS